MPDEAATRLGVLGGTFDPPHFGHLAAALEVRWRLGLDEVLMVVANDPWQKSSLRPVTPARLRLAMVQAAVAGRGGLTASSIEIDRGGESLTADTLARLRADRPGAELFLVVGSDAAEGLDGWKRCDEVRALATTVVVDRAGREGGRPPGDWPAVVVEAPGLAISSRDLRARFAEGRPVAALVPSGVIEVVAAHRLYRGGP